MDDRAEDAHVDQMRKLRAEDAAYLEDRRRSDVARLRGRGQALMGCDGFTMPITPEEHDALLAALKAMRDTLVTGSDRGEACALAMGCVAAATDCGCGPGEAVGRDQAREQAALGFAFAWRCANGEGG